MESKDNKIQAHYPAAVNKETVIRKLAEEGMILTADKLEDITLF